MSDPNVFIVDDDSGVRKSLSLLAKSAGLRAESYASGYEFLDFCTPEVSGCIVLDVRMPGMDGLQLQESLAARGIGLPIVFITGHGDVRTSVLALKGGGVDFFEKPFDDDELLESVRVAMALDAHRR
ncbi:MAG: response regulator transcription factor, partial [Planctomycetes bacterium]|nr:response regulator transcription factor [Planctomycetota bacterium]